MRLFILLSFLATMIGFARSWRSPRRMLYLIFYFSLIEGAYINYFYPRQITLVLKDLLVLYTYGLVVAQGKMRLGIERMGGAIVPIGLFAAIYVLHVFNPYLNSLLIGLVGLRVAIFYIPLAFVALVAFENEVEVWRFLRFCILLTIPVCLYGVLQYFGGGAHIAALGPGYVKRGVAILYGGGTSGHTLRTLSTFTYSSSFSMFVMLMMPFAWVSIGMNLMNRWRLFAIACVMVLFAAQISSGGRQALIFTVMAMLVTELWNRRALLARIGAPLVVLGGLVLGFFIFGQEKLARYETILDLEQVRWRYETYFVQNNLLALETSPLGHGSGAGSTAARHVGSIGFWQTETAFSKLVYEVGIPGMLAYFWMLGSILAAGRRIVRTLRSTLLRSYVRGFMGLGVLIFLTSFNGWPLDIPPANALFWVFAGVALLAPHLERKAAHEALLEEAMRAEAEAAPVGAPA